MIFKAPSNPDHSVILWIEAWINSWECRRVGEVTQGRTLISLCCCPTISGEKPSAPGDAAHLSSHWLWEQPKSFLMMVFEAFRIILILEDSIVRKNPIFVGQRRKSCHRRKLFCAGRSCVGACLLDPSSVHDTQGLSFGRHGWTCAVALFRQCLSERASACVCVGACLHVHVCLPE